MSQLPKHIAYTRSIKTQINCNLSHSGGHALSLEQLLAFDANVDFSRFKHQALGYASVAGEKALRENIVAFHRKANHQMATISADNVLTFSGAQEALAAIYHSVLNADDEVVVFTPSYPSLTSMVNDIGARLIDIPLTFESKWQFNIEQLSKRVSNKTKLIVINSPHNPTGATLTRDQKQTILTLAKQLNCYLLCDDVSQHIKIDKALDISHPFLEYEKTIAVSVMSKSLGLGGIRVGWAITPDNALMNKLISYKARSSICTSLVDEQLANLALANSQSIIEQNSKLVHDNVEIFNQFVASKKGLFTWHMPKAGLLSLVQVNIKQPIMQWAPKFTEDTGVLILPSELFGLSGNYFRLGLGQQYFAVGIEQLAKYPLFR